MNVYLSVCLAVLCVVGVESVITGYATCDNKMEFYADGILKASHSNWPTATPVSLDDNTKVVGIYCKDFGVVGGIKAFLNNGIKTDKTWKCSPKYYPNWNKPGFDDSNWADAVEPTFNWGSQPSQLNGQANWIWTARWRFQDKDVYCRKVINNGTDCECCEELKKQISSMDAKLERLLSLLGRPPFILPSSLKKEDKIIRN